MQGLAVWRFITGSDNRTSMKAVSGEEIEAEVRALVLPSAVPQMVGVDHRRATVSGAIAGNATSFGCFASATGHNPDTLLLREMRQAHESGSKVLRQLRNVDRSKDESSGLPELRQARQAGRAVLHRLRRSHLVSGPRIAGGAGVALRNVSRNRIASTYSTRMSSFQELWDQFSLRDAPWIPGRQRQDPRYHARAADYRS